MKLSSRAMALKPSPTLALAAKAKELTAQGKDIISLTVGEPDWDTFSSIKEAGIQALKAGQTKYAPSSGIPELRAEIAKRTSQELGLTYSAAEVTVTAGGKMVIFAALQMLCDEGDEVIVPAPFWVSYPDMSRLAGASVQIVECSAAARFKLTADQLKKAIHPRTKVLILNSPSNPTGEMYSRSELLALAEVLRQHPQVMILSDDIYNRLTLEGDELAPHILHVAPDLKDRVLVVNGASKTYSMTGWRLGWALGPKTLIDAMTNYFSQSVSCASPFTQQALLQGFRAGDDEVKHAVQQLRARAKSAFQSLKSVPGLEVSWPSGAFYLWPSVHGWIGKTHGSRRLEDSRAVAEVLLSEAMVAVVPGVEFGAEGYLRMSYVVSEKRWAEAVDRLKKFASELR